jgi:hypothetical protein
MSFHDDAGVGGFFHPDLMPGGQRQRPAEFCSRCGASFDDVHLRQALHGAEAEFCAVEDACGDRTRAVAELGGDEFGVGDLYGEVGCRPHQLDPGGVFRWHPGDGVGAG